MLRTSPACSRLVSPRQIRSKPRMKTTRRLADKTTRSRPSLETWAMRDVSMKSLREPKSMNKHNRNKPRKGIIYFGGKRQKGNKLVPRYSARILHALTILYGGVRRYLQDLAAALPRKHMHRIRLAHERVALVHVDVAEIPETVVDGLHEGTRAHVVQESMLVARGYECRVREPVRVRGLGERQQRPGPELPSRRVLMVYRRSPGGRAHLLVVRRRTGGDLVLGGKVTGQAPDFLLPVFAVKDEISVFVLAMGMGADVRLQATNLSTQRNPKGWG